jgi:hypothetical protein
VEYEDDFELIPRLQFRREHKRLRQNAHKENKIIAGQKGDFDELRHSQCSENDDRKNAAKSLPVTEKQK